ncbi:hypothetical protein [Geobacillus thermodenitrificans]|uniref:hypothetical protein n=1 Tax=Geobacillus thermodenitrificans TaxID=33940 RepID=UPI000D35F0D1|nr:hypothetical protein [Geobacillus thermodenitrificans]PTR46163.1 hypothetical protein CW755_15010 [Geobacillus thermodenitrificans]
MALTHQKTQGAWVYAVHRFLHRVVEAYCETTPSLRSPFQLLKLIEMHRPLLSLSLFPSPLHYGLVLAKVTDHLLQFFGSADETECKPLLLVDGGNEGEAEDWNGTNLCIVYRDRVRVLLWCEEEREIRNYKERLPSLCREAVGFCPHELECCFLWTGGRRIEWMSAG